MEQFLPLIKEFFSTHGPVAIGWLLAGYLLWHVLGEKRKPNDQVIKAYQDVLDEYHVALVASTRAMEHLATLIEERTRKQSPRLGSPVRSNPRDEPI